jgi:hypothetical protein
MKKVVLISLIVSASLFAESLSVKYWKLPTMTYQDTVLGKKDSDLYKKWIRNNSSDLVIFNNVSDQFAIDRFATFFKPICSSPLGKNKSKTCIYTSPTLSNDTSIKIMPSDDINNLFDIKPIMFIINNEIGIVVMDSIDNSTKSSSKYIETTIKYFAKKGNLKESNIAVIGSFDKSGDYLKSSLTKDLDVKFTTGTKIVKNGKYNLYSTENLITPKNEIFNKALIQYDVTQLSSKYSTANKQESMELYSSNVSQYYPISFRINYEFEKIISKKIIK